MAMDLRLGWDLGLEADLVKAQERLSVETPHLLMAFCCRHSTQCQIE